MRRASRTRLLLAPTIIVGRVLDTSMKAILIEQASPSCGLVSPVTLKAYHFFDFSVCFLMLPIEVIN